MGQRMEIDGRTSPGCLGKIQKHYNRDDLCRELCPYTALCVIVLMGELLRGNLLNDRKETPDG